MYAYHEDSRVIAVPVLAADEVDVDISRWGEESGPGDAGVQKNGVGVKPPVPIDISGSFQTFL